MRRHRPSGPLDPRAKRLLDGGVGYYLFLLTWAAARGGTVKAEPLGAVYTEAVERCETRSTASLMPGAPVARMDYSQGFTLDWLFAEYRASGKYQRLKSRQQYELSMARVGQYMLLKDPRGRMLGQVGLDKVTHAVAQKLYNGLVARPDGTLRPTHINCVMRDTCGPRGRRSRAAPDASAGSQSIHAPGP